jgi:hypothetical protein
LFRRRDSAAVASSDGAASTPGILSTPEDAYEAGLVMGSASDEGLGMPTGILARLLMRRRGIVIQPPVHEAGKARGQRAGSPPKTR